MREFGKKFGSALRRGRQRNEHHSRRFGRCGCWRSYWNPSGGCQFTLLLFLHIFGRQKRQVVPLPLKLDGFIINPRLDF